jgi:16S rRNA (guanine(966)-N(2))-methyltransferase RsmD
LRIGTDEIRNLKSEILNNRMRIISGDSKGRKLAGPKSQSVRPTSDRVKESIFNILRGDVEGKTVLDLFAGTGSLGIEALSRGAKRALFVEKGRQALWLIQRNLAACGMSARAELLPREVHRALGILMRREEIFDLILMDPPYEKGLIEKTLRKLNACRIYHGNSILVIQHDRREPLPRNLGGWALNLQRRIGDTLISFLTPDREPEAPPRESALLQGRVDEKKA